MIIAIDFDGTIVEHTFPTVGPPVPHAIEVMKKLQAAGHKLILYTMRSDKDTPNHGKGEILSTDGEKFLTQAVEYCRNNGIDFWAVNNNPDQHTWTISPKVYANLYIDDAALGCPLTSAEDNVDSIIVDWRAVEADLIGKGFLPPLDDKDDGTIPKAEVIAHIQANNGVCRFNCWACHFNAYGARCEQHQFPARMIDCTLRDPETKEITLGEAELKITKEDK